MTQAQIQTEIKLYTFDEFIEWYPNDGKRYELHEGVIIEMPPPTGKHEGVVGFLATLITVQYFQMGLPFRLILPLVCAGRSCIWLRWQFFL